MNFRLALLLLLGAAQLSDSGGLRPLRSLPAPAAGESVLDQTFGVQILRLTDRGEKGGLATAEYTQLQPMNADETKILISTERGFEVMELATRTITHQGFKLEMPRWHPTLADVLIGFNHRKGEGAIKYRHLILKGGGTWEDSERIDLSALGFTELDKGCWEDASMDGRVLPLLGKQNGKLVAAALDISQGKLQAVVKVSNVDWTAISPSGAYLLVQYVKCGATEDAGLVIYDAKSGARLGWASDHYEHGDVGLDEAGQEVFSTIPLEGICPRPAARFSVTPLAKGLSARRYVRTFEPAVGFYTSCRSHRRGGFCLNSDDKGVPGSAPFAGELWLTRMRDGAVLRLAHHRSSAKSYYTLVRPVLSPSGRFALFSSDWARPNGDDQTDLYLIDLSPHLDDFLAPPAALVSTQIAPRGGCGCRGP